MMGSGGGWEQSRGCSCSFFTENELPGEPRAGLSPGEPCLALPGSQRPAPLDAPAGRPSSPGCPYTAAAAASGSPERGALRRQPCGIIWDLMPWWCMARWVRQHHTRPVLINPMSGDVGSRPLLQCRMRCSPTESFPFLHLRAGRGSAGHIPKAKRGTACSRVFQAAR